MKKHISLFTLFLFFQSILFSQSNEEWDEYVYYVGETLADSLRNQDSTLLNSIFDEDLFLEKILIRKDDPNIQQYNQTYGKQLKSEINLGKTLMESTIGNYYDFINYYTSVDGEVHLIFRLLTKEGGFNYHDVSLEWRDSSLQVTDVFFYFNGEKYSQTLHLIYKNLLRGALDAEVGNSFVDVGRRTINMLFGVKRLLNEEKYKEAQEKFEKIPLAIRQQRIFMFYRVKIAMGLTNQEYIDAMQAYVEKFPDDPSAFMMGYEKALKMKEYDMALKYINKIDISVGLDPFLDYYRGNIYLTTKNYKEAEKKLRGIVDDFKIEKGYDQLLKVYLLTAQNEEAITLLQSYITDFGYEKKGVVDWFNETHPDYIELEEFVEWKNLKKD